MAAGHGSRMGTELPKQFLPLGGRAVLHTTIRKFVEAVPDISVVTVLPQGGEYADWWRRYCVENNFNCPQMIVSGGITRFHSVKAAFSCNRHNFFYKPSLGRCYRSSDTAGCE